MAKETPAKDTQDLPDAPVATTSVAPVVQPSKEVTDFPLTLEEFCTRLSSTDSRVELIGAFFYVENKAGTVKDTHANFSARFTAFETKPV
jgi:hypothetical protein